MSEPCPQTARLQGLLAEKLDSTTTANLTAHVEHCLHCQQTLENLSPMSRSWSDVLAANCADELTPEPGLEHILKTAPQPEDVNQTQAESASAQHGEALAFLAPSVKPGHLGRLGHYEILSVVGKGGFGIVLKAFDDKLHRVVAVKVLAPELAVSGPARERFVREARAAAAVKNDHVIAIYNVADEHFPPYIVMEMIDGLSLQDRLDRDGPLPLKEILRIGLQIAEGLTAAHKQGVVHRDIKPANILLENGVQRVKITDFGLARLVDDASITQSGVIAGTPLFMSPEQANGEKLDHRADLFSLGSVLYVMATGRPPFRASTTMAVLKRVCEDVPTPIREINNDIPVWLCDIIQKLHAKKSEHRCQTAKELVNVLQLRLAELQQPMPNSSPVVASEPVRAAPEEAPVSNTTRLRALLLRLLTGFAIFASVFTVLSTAAYYTGRHFMVYPPDIAIPAAGIAAAATLLLATFALVFRARPRLRSGLWRAALCSSLTAIGLVLFVGVVFDGGGYSGFQVVCDDPDMRLHLAGDWFDEDVVSGTNLRVPRGNYLFTAEKNGTIHMSKQLHSYSWGPLRVPGLAASVTSPWLREQGWVQLFNGQDLTGWQPHPKFPGGWSVDNGVLVGGGLSQLSYLASTRNDFENFHLYLEVLLPSEQDAGGVNFRGSLETAVEPTVGERLARPLFWAPISFNNGEYWTGNLAWHFGGKNFGSIRAPLDLARAKEWFVLEIIARGPHVLTKVNGRRAAESRGFIPVKPGHILLDRYGPNREIHFRKIAIKELPAK